MTDHFRTLDPLAETAHAALDDLHRAITAAGQDVDDRRQFAAAANARRHVTVALTYLRDARNELDRLGELEARGRHPSGRQR